MAPTSTVSVVPQSGPITRGPSGGLAYDRRRHRTHRVPLTVAHRRSLRRLCCNAYAESMLARVPASSANLGPGFDALAVALTRYVEVSRRARRRASRSPVRVAARVSSTTRRHLGARVAARVLGHHASRCTSTPQIPLSRGLGFLGGPGARRGRRGGSAATPGDRHRDRRPRGERRRLAAGGSGGGAAWTNAAGSSRAPCARSSVALRRRRARRGARDRRRARVSCPAQVPFDDAVHNVSAVALLIAGLAPTARISWPASMDDYLHQPYRMSLLPFAQPLLGATCARRVRRVRVGRARVRRCWRSVTERHRRDGGARRPRIPRALTRCRVWSGSSTLTGAGSSSPDA